MTSPRDVLHAEHAASQQRCALAQTSKKREETLSKQNVRNHGHQPRKAGRQGDIRRWRKRAQLITQISQSVQMFLADQEDEALCTLCFSHADLVGSGEHVQIVMIATKGGEEEIVDLKEIQRKLDAIAPDARIEVAHEINRKRAPLISFLVVPG